MAQARFLVNHGHAGPAIVVSPSAQARLMDDVWIPDDLAMPLADERRQRRRLPLSAERCSTDRMTPDCIVTSPGSSRTLIRNGRSRPREQPAAWIPTPPSSTRVLERF